MYASTRGPYAGNECAFRLEDRAAGPLLGVLPASDLFDHYVAVKFRDHAFDLGNLVASLDREPRRFRPNALVVFLAQLECGQALGVAALAQDLDRRVGTVGEVLDPLVYLAEERLPPRESFERYRHDFSVPRGHSAGNGDLWSAASPRLDAAKNEMAPKGARPTQRL
jgi:hypothetical protein